MNPAPIKLWVDDLRQPPPGWHWVKTVTEAIRALDTFTVSEVSIDFDIEHTKDPKPGSGILIPLGKCTETFEPVARYLVAKTRWANYPVRVVVHTGNGDAADKMMKILRGASWHKLESKMCATVPEGADW